MEINTYKALVCKKPIKTKPRNRPLPKPSEKYLEAFEWDIGIYASKYQISHHPTGPYSGLEI